MLNYECKVESKSAILRELTISISAEVIGNYIEQQYLEVQKTAKIKGFRVGKVPLNLIKQYYAKDVKEDVFSKLVRESYSKALEENKITAIGLPEIQTKSGSTLTENQPLVFIANVEIMPEIKLCDFSKITLKRHASEVSEKDLEATFKRLQEAHAEMILVPDYKDLIKKGDFVELSFQGTIDGKPYSELNKTNQLVEIGSGRLLQAFEDVLIGMQIGQSKTFPLLFPDDFHIKTLAGKTAEMQVTLHEFKTKKLPELNDDLAKLFKAETLLELRKSVENTLKEDKTRQAQQDLERDLYKVLLEKHEFEVPVALVRSQLEHLVQQFKKDLDQKLIKPEELAALAERQVRCSLVLQKVAQTQNIQVDTADFEHEYQRIAENLNVSIEQVHQVYEQKEEAKRQLRFKLKESRTIEYLLTVVQLN